MPLLILAMLFGWLLPNPLHAQDVPSPLTRIAFGSCADEEKPQPIWDAVLAYQPQLFLFAGDNVYGDVRQGRDVPDAELIQSLQESYAQTAQVSGMVRLRSTIPHLATWDDHDYGKNDAGAEFAGRHEAQQLFLQFWDVPLSDVRHRREGIYHSQTFGPDGQRVQVILLDTRFFRSPLKPTDQRNAAGRERYLPDEDPGKTMLGAAQWSWLAERLREPADVRLIVSSIQVVAEGHGWERWGNFPRERQRLYDLIHTTGAGGVILLSGDRHVGGLYRETTAAPYALIEITSSGLNQIFPGNREAGPNRLGAVYGAPNFGTIDVDWWERTVTLALRSENGEPVRRQVVRLDELRIADP
ncbi:alkaline phosphatase D family protein [Microvirga sp. VF16]|uniref:alkaline phosphatase D family protein n=1 Tax=Microvirga sp. VF16 TaxID=2807101 RepID=UPI00193DAFAB|nr:alkaline phosphatase D family protein [Microvirga sp. VF16]QRM29064.1 alkaline phosphatase family protein [Microvirga sp. VF16]